MHDPGKDMSSVYSIKSAGTDTALTGQGARSMDEREKGHKSSAVGGRELLSLKV